MTIPDDRNALYWHLDATERSAVYAAAIAAQMPPTRIDAIMREPYVRLLTDGSDAGYALRYALDRVREWQSQ